ncbi:MAG TPA: NAD(P)-dependent oxidoreductase [Trichormus sp.]|jgi:nucleoside-diphosphate-sugar epimerase
MTKKTILITGAAGNIGKKLREHLDGRYTLKMVDIEPLGDPDISMIDLSKWDDSLVELFDGVDVVVHLAADPQANKTWEELIAPNLDALNNVFVGAIKARVPRVIFASSNHVMGGYSAGNGSGRWLTTKLEHKPGTQYESRIGECNSTPYGSMKLFGERLGKCYAEAADAVCVAIRIGWVCRIGDNRPDDLPKDAPTWFKRMWLSTPDMCRLMEQAITVALKPKTFLVVNGMSDNEGMVWNIEETKALLGYAPVDGLTLSQSARVVD